MDRATDRLCPKGSLTADERERARLAYEQTPSLLDGPVMAALAHCDHGKQVAEAMLARVRGGTP